MIETRIVMVGSLALFAGLVTFDNLSVIRVFGTTGWLN